LLGAIAGHDPGGTDVPVPDYGAGLASRRIWVDRRRLPGGEPRAEVGHPRRVPGDERLRPQVRHPPAGRARRTTGANPAAARAALRPAGWETLRVAWAAINGICAKRRVPFLPELVPTLQRHGHPWVTDAAGDLLLTLGPATADRLLRPVRQPHGISDIIRQSRTRSPCTSERRHVRVALLDDPVSEVE
jgi:hypothetical protein